MTGGKQSQLLVLRLSLEFDKISKVLPKCIKEFFKAFKAFLRGSHEGSRVCQRCFQSVSRIFKEVSNGSNKVYVAWHSTQLLVLIESASRTFNPVP